MMIAISGTCSFCTKDAESVFGLAGTRGRSHRICNDCVGLCLDIMAEERIDDDVIAAEPLLDVPEVDGFEMTPELESAIADVQESHAEMMRRFIEEEERWKEEHTRTVHEWASFSCSFCDKSQREVAKLIQGGPSVFVCDLCVGDASAILSACSRLRA
jgi:ATP-dependent protease Clp ATPase subunit